MGKKLYSQESYQLLKTNTRLNQNKVIKEFPALPGGSVKTRVIVESLLSF